MASNLRVDQILPTTGTNIGIGTAGGNIIVGGATTEVVVNGGLHVTGGLNISTGSVGVGTDNPYGKLHIGNSPEDVVNDVDTTNTSLIIKQSTNNRDDGIYIERGGERKGYYMWLNPGGGAGDGLTFSRNNAGTYSNALILDRNADAHFGGNLVIENGKGIDFQNAGISSNTASAHILDDYEEGNWTPSTTNFTYTVNANDCHYTKIGRRVFVHGQLTRNQVAAPSSAMFEITGMPFNRGTNLRSIEGSFWLDNGGTASDYIGGLCYFYTTTNLIFAIGSNPAQQASTRYIDATHFNNTRGILFYVSYSVD